MKKLSMYNLFWGFVGIVACFFGFSLMSIAPQIRTMVSEFSMYTTYILFILEIIVGTIGGIISFIGAHTAIYQLTGISLYREYIRYVESPERKRIGN